MYSNETTNLLFDAYLNYALESGKSNLSVTAGHSYQSFDMITQVQLRLNI